MVYTRVEFAGVHGAFYKGGQWVKIQGRLCVSVSSRCRGVMELVQPHCRGGSRRGHERISCGKDAMNERHCQQLLG